MISRVRGQGVVPLVEDGLTLNIDQLIKARFLIPGSRMSGRLDWTFNRTGERPRPLAMSHNWHCRMPICGFALPFGIRSVEQAIQ